jgi:hypothetical protein
MLSFFCKTYKTLSNQSIHVGHRFGGIDEMLRGHAYGPSRERLGRVYTLLELGLGYDLRWLGSGPGWSQGISFSNCLEQCKFRIKAVFTFNVGSFEFGLRLYWADA